jgi:hypothetical protein
VAWLSSSIAWVTKQCHEGGWLRRHESFFLSLYFLSVSGRIFVQAAFVCFPLLINEMPAFAGSFKKKSRIT